MVPNFSKSSFEECLDLFTKTKALLSDTFCKTSLQIILNLLVMGRVPLDRFNVNQRIEMHDLMFPVIARALQAHCNNPMVQEHTMAPQLNVTDYRADPPYSASDYDKLADHCFEWIYRHALYDGFQINAPNIIDGVKITQKQHGKVFAILSMYREFMTRFLEQHLNDFGIGQMMQTMKGPLSFPLFYTCTHIRIHMQSHANTHLYTLYTCPNMIIS